MAWDSVPWLIGGDSQGGAQHSPEIMRLISYYALGGREGVLGAYDLRVAALETAGPGFRVLPGACGVLSRWQSSNMYVSRMAQETVEDAGPATDSSGSRSDLVVANIKDPFAPGSPWDPPADRLNGPYIETTVITDVPPNTKHFNDLGITNWSALALARIDMPPSTATITGSMIKDLRVVNNPLTGIEPPPNEQPAPESASKTWTEASHTTSGSRLGANAYQTWIDWPAEANWQVPIPPWATGVDIFVLLNPAMEGPVWGALQLSIDGTNGYATQFDDDWIEGAGGQRTMIMVSGTQAIPTSSRGKIATVKLQGTSHSSTVGDLVAGEGCYVYVNLNFKQQPSFV